MAKVSRRRSHTREFLRKRWSIESISTESETSSSEEEEEVMIMSDEDVHYINFSTESILNDINDLFSFCTEQINTRFISVLMYMSIRPGLPPHGFEKAEISSKKCGEKREKAETYIFDGFLNFI